MSSERKGVGSVLQRTIKRITPSHLRNKSSGEKELKRILKLPDRLSIMSMALYERKFKEGISMEQKGLPFQLISDTNEPDVMVRVALANGLLSESFPVDRAAIESDNLGADGKRNYLRVQVVTAVDDGLAMVNIPANLFNQTIPKLNVGHVMAVDPKSLLPLNQKN